MSSSTIRRKVQAIKKKKLKAQKVVSLADYRELTIESSVKNILVVDDDPIVLSALKRVLDGQRGYRVVVARDGVELTECLETTRFHMCIMDVHLPWIDGYELCRLIKSHPRYVSLPLILVTSLTSSEDMKKGYECGCDDILIKPFDMNFIVDTVDRTLCS